MNCKHSLIISHYGKHYRAQVSNLFLLRKESVDYREVFLVYVYVFVSKSRRFLPILNVSLGQWSIFFCVCLWAVFYLLIYFNCLKWTSCRVGSVLTFIWSLIFIKSLVLLYYINNLINTVNTYLTGVSKSIEPANLLLIFWKKKKR